MFKKQYVIWMVLGLSLTITSCEKFRKSINETKEGPAVDSGALAQSSDTTGSPASASLLGGIQKERSGFGGDVAALEKAERSLRSLPELQGKKVYVYHSIHFYDDYRILLRIQNPDTLNYVDEYYYRDDKWNGPTPVVMSKFDNVARDLVNLDKIPFRNASHVYQAMTEKLAEIGSHSADRTVYVVTYNNKIRWYPRTLSNSRARFSIEYKEDGTLQSFSQD